MIKHESMSPGEELLTQVLGECADEDLSFVPPEREIARSHTFSKAFEDKLKEYISAQKAAKARKVRRHFMPRYRALAACVLAFCVCGILFYSILKPRKSMEQRTGTAKKAREDTAADGAWEEPEKSGAAGAETMDEMPAGALESAQEDSGAQKAGKKSRNYCGRKVELAERQEVPESSGGVTVLVNCPVQDEENPVIYLTIGNTGEETASYTKDYVLEVWLEDGWYVILPEDRKEADSFSEEKLEAGMAVDEEIDLNSFQMDYSAERYRMVIRINGEPVGAEFTFEEAFSQRMEKEEGEGRIWNE